MENKRPFQPRLKAVALKYDPSDVAPKVIAKGAGVVADKIIEKGRDAKIPVLKDTKLTEDLTRLEFGEFIPPELYDVVAQVLLFIDRLDREESLRQYEQY